jgi:hypothetical protein
MGYAIVLGGLALLYFGAKGEGPLGSVATALAGATHGAVKLGNADPNFESWLADEVNTLIGPPSSTNGFNTVYRNELIKAIRTRRLQGYTTGGPEGGSGSEASFAAGLLGQAASVPIPVPGVNQAIAFASSIFSFFGAHHAAAVQREQSTLNAANPAVNRALDAIDRAYKLGQLGSAQVKTYLEQLYTQYVSQLSSIAQPAAFDAAATVHSHHCNAGCTQERELRGIVDAMELFDY